MQLRTATERTMIMSAEDVVIDAEEVMHALLSVTQQLEHIL